ncbi:Fruiting body protein SC1 [Leucoagaricus sp. SymC.cos]|nr:Fruiting body protein SC1 [Leucoagaricus sp. SymC.cos]
MHAKFFALATLFAVAAAAPGGEPEGKTSTCSTGPVQCCSQVQSIDHPAVKQAVEEGGLLHLIDLDALIGQGNVEAGLDCSPINVIAVQGNQCSAQAVCCDNNDFNGLVAIGCTPININA